ncbi:MAG: hypothetical protein N4J56_002916 [Chroococcidiopsis sp. SAG 2025]|nr:hypothetical protein [Chroococcidiopsis sp. SAG 2025]
MQLLKKYIRKYYQKQSVAENHFIIILLLHQLFFARIVSF